MDGNYRLTFENARKHDETGSLIYFYSSYLTGMHGYS